MDMNRRGFIGAGAVLAAGIAAGSRQAQAEGRAKRAFVAACPPSSREYASRRPGPTRVMMIGAHPDDTDITCGGLTVKLISRGFQVRFASVTDGRMGHQNKDVHVIIDWILSYFLNHR